MALCVDVTERDLTLPTGEEAMIGGEEIVALRARIRAELADRPPLTDRQAARIAALITAIRLRAARRAAARSGLHDALFALACLALLALVFWAGLQFVVP
jgi:hypothetical protein